MQDLTRENIERFNRKASEWDTSPRRAAAANAVAKAIQKAIPLQGSERALEFGCGTGLITIALAPRLGSVLAMDSATAMLEQLRAKARGTGIDNLEILEGDLPTRLPEGPFDLIFSSMTLHHINDTEGLFQALFTLLRPGGQIAVADLDREDGSFHGDTAGIAHHGFERGDLEAKLETAGFGQVRFSTAHIMEKESNDGSVRRYPIFLACARRDKTCI